MFTSLKAVAYRVSDLSQAKLWYKAILGREPVLDSPFAVFFPVGESVLSLLPAGDSTSGTGQQAIAY
jgi:catechol 2,3-dioxygenase-like lactoylglutathione lyase family enzyme